MFYVLVNMLFDVYLAQRFTIYNANAARKVQ